MRQSPTQQGFLPPELMQLPPHPQKPWRTLPKCLWGEVNMPQPAPPVQTHPQALPSPAPPAHSPRPTPPCLLLHVSRGSSQAHAGHSRTLHSTRKRAWPHPRLSPSQARTHTWGLPGVALQDKLLVTGEKSLFGKSRELAIGTGTRAGHVTRRPAE